MSLPFACNSLISKLVQSFITGFLVQIFFFEFLWNQLSELFQAIEWKKKKKKKWKKKK